MRALFFICSFLCISSIALAQKDTTSVDVERPRFYVLVDYGKIATLATNFETKVEGGVGFRLSKNLFVVGYVGNAKLVPNNAIENGTYEASGLYFRTGIDYYFSIDQVNSLILGARYAQSSFQETLSYAISSDLFDPVEQTVTRDNISAQWAELSIGSEAHLGEGPFYAGGYFSLRVLVDRDEFDPTDTYTIPGYGRTFDKTIPAIQLYLKVKLF